MNSGKINYQIGQLLRGGWQKQLRDGEEIEMSDTNAEACNVTDKLPNHSNDLLNMIWKTMQEKKNGKELGERLRKIKNIERRIRKDRNI
jgi:hypothetical protein